MVGPVDFSRVEALAFHKPTSALYGVDNGTGNLVKLPRAADGTWGRWQAIGPTGRRITDMTVGPDGTLYGISPGAGNGSDIVKVDVASGRSTFSTKIGTIFGAGFSTIAYQPTTGQFISTAGSTLGGRGATIAFDPETGERSRLTGAPRLLDTEGDPTSRNLIANFPIFSRSSRLLELPTDGSNADILFESSPLEGVAVVPNNPLTDRTLLSAAPALSVAQDAVVTYRPTRLEPGDGPAPRPTTVSGSDYLESWVSALFSLGSFFDKAEEIASDERKPLLARNYDLLIECSIASDISPDVCDAANERATRDVARNNQEFADDALELWDEGAAFATLGAANANLHADGLLVEPAAQLLIDALPLDLEDAERDQLSDAVTTASFAGEVAKIILNPTFSIIDGSLSVGLPSGFLTPSLVGLHFAHFGSFLGNDFAFGSVLVESIAFGEEEDEIAPFVCGRRRPIGCRISRRRPSRSRNRRPWRCSGLA